MKYSQKQAAPTAFNDWMGMANEDWSPSYDNLSGPPRASVVQALMAEQGFVCAYCGRGLKADGSDSHIDHFWPQAHFGPASANDRSIDYNNFFLSCGPNRYPEGHPKRVPVTCGDAKGDNFDLMDYIIPSDQDCEERFRYGSLGTILPKIAGDKAAENMLDWLKLTDKALEYERRDLLTRIEASIATGDISATTKDEYLDIWRSKDDSGRLKSLSHVVARYIEEEI